MRIDVIFAGLFCDPGCRLVLVVARPYVAAVRGLLFFEPGIRTEPSTRPVSEPNFESLIEPSFPRGAGSTDCDCTYPGSSDLNRTGRSRLPALTGLPGFATAATMLLINRPRYSMNRRVVGSSPTGGA